MFEHYYYYSISIGNFFIVLNILIPIFSAFALIIWKVAKLDSCVEKNAADIAKVADKQRDSDDQHTITLQNLMNKFDVFGVTQVQLTTSMKYVENDLKELKASVKLLEQQKKTNGRNKGN